MKQISVQVQSILYGNDPKSIHRAIDNVANAVNVTRKTPQALGEGIELGKVTFAHGDASPVPVFTNSEYDKICREYQNLLEMKQTVFGENTGHSGGQNQLAMNCKADYILILNPDVLVNPHIFEQLLLPFLSQNGGEIGITEARQTPIEHHKQFNPNTGETEWATGACMLFPTHIYREVGGFDHESFFMYCDDVDYSWRVRLAGYQIRYMPQASVFHSKHISQKGYWLPTSAEQYYSAEAALIMAHKWSHPKKLAEILNYFKNSSEVNQQKAASAFLKRKKMEALPASIDPNHTVANFTRHGYGEYRFLY